MADYREPFLSQNRNMFHNVSMQLYPLRLEPNLLNILRILANLGKKYYILSTSLFQCL